MTCCTFCDGLSCDVYSLNSMYDSLYNDKMLSSYMYINYVLFIVFCNCSHAVLPSIFAVPMREWLGEHSFTSSSFPIAVLGGAQRLCSWSFMYEYHHFTVWSTDESLIDISCNAYSVNDCVQYVFCCSSSLFKCCSSVYFCCSHVIVSRCPSWYICLCRFNILTLLYLFWCWSFLCISLQWINK